MGRAFGVGSIELFMHHLKNMSFTNAFVPQGAPHGTQGQPGML
jgi:hypothetical protein